MIVPAGSVSSGAAFVEPVMAIGVAVASVAARGCPGMTGGSPGPGRTGAGLAVLFVGGIVMGVNGVLVPGPGTGNVGAGAAMTGTTTFVAALALVSTVWGAGAGLPAKAFCRASCNCAFLFGSLESAGSGAKLASAAPTSPQKELRINVRRMVFTIV